MKEKKKYIYPICILILIWLFEECFPLYNIKVLSKLVTHFYVDLIIHR
jgi:hypothetical protein